MELTFDNCTIVGSSLLPSRVREVFLRAGEWDSVPVSVDFEGTSKTLLSATAQTGEYTSERVVVEVIDQGVSEVLYHESRRFEFREPRVERT